VIYRFDAPLLFANAKTFRDEVLRLARTEPPPRWIVVAAEPITDVDTTASDVLFELDHLLDERGQNLVFAELKDPVRRKIERYGLTHAIEARHFFPTVKTAVEAFRAQTGADWTAPAPSVPVGEGASADIDTDQQAPGSSVAPTVGPVPRVSSEDHVPKSPA
jgi:anti-anti-sigma regulatory factor